MARLANGAGDKGMTKSGFCTWQNVEGNSHELCKLKTCTCTCHKEGE